VTTTASSTHGMASAHNTDMYSQYSLKKKKLKLKLMESKGYFADHCKEFDDSHRVQFKPLKAKEF